MLGKRDRQLSFADADNWQAKIPKDSFWYQLNAWADAHLKDEEFAHLFSERMGRPSINPTRMVRAILIQLEKGLSDRELEEASWFDDRVKYALGTGRSPDRPVDHASLCRYRKRFLEDDTARELLRKTLQQAVAAKLFEGARTDLVDSFLVPGAGARQDTYTLIRKAMARLLRLAQEEGINIDLERSDYLTKGKPRINWDDPEARRELLASLVRDARRAVEQVGNEASASGELKEAAQLLQLVAEQDIEEKDGRIDIKQGTARDRIISVTDPEMRHGHKTASTKVDGYKANLMVGGKGCALVTSIAVTPANRPDKAVLGELLERRCADTGLQVERLIGDSAYGDAETRLKLPEGITLVAKVPPASNSSGHFPKEAFEINLEEGWIGCPGGQRIKMERKRKDAPGWGIFTFPAERCLACGLRSKCTDARGGRTIRIHPHEELLQEARARQKTPEFIEEYRGRSVVERVIAHLTRHGARKSRYIGNLKTEFQLTMRAVAHNIKTIARLVKAQAATASA